jgi:hypothetical protein
LVVRSRLAHSGVAAQVARVLTYVWPGAALGAALSASAGALFADIAGGLDDFEVIIRVLTLGWFGAWGALLGAATAWLIWLMRRPDRDAATDIAAEFE